jgi:fructuronate reductase
VTDVKRKKASATFERSAPRPPVRIVHLGIGAFHRAHQAWYTAHASDAQDWGIAAFTGRSPAVAHKLADQDGLYTLVERGADGDRFEVVESIVRVEPGSNVDALTALLSDGDVAIVTLTITEAGYRLTPEDHPDLSDPEVAADLNALRGRAAKSSHGELPTTALGRLLLGLDERRRSGSGPIAIVSCDNLPDNGGRLGRGLRAFADGISPDLEKWVAEHVSFVQTSVDRITPRTTESDRAEVLAVTGRDDQSPVVTEPFSDWVLSGEFPAGRPDWEAAGARFVDDIEPWERRKLWLLNGAHTLLAAAGPLLGRATVAEAITDPRCRQAVELLWDDAIRHLPEELQLSDYRSALLDRFENPRIEHRLEQIASDALRKLRLRVAPVARLEISAGRSADGCAAAIAAWIVSVRRSPAAEKSQSGSSTAVLVGSIDETLGRDQSFVHRVSAAVSAWETAARSTETVAPAAVLK